MQEGTKPPREPMLQNQVFQLVETDQLSMKLAFLAAYSHRQEAQLRLSRTTSIPEQRFGQKGQFEASQTEEVNGFSGIHY